MKTSDGTKAFNKKWIAKRNEMSKSYTSYLWGLTIVGIIIILMLLYMPFM